jgi:hypothetical protein
MAIGERTHNDDLTTAHRARDVNLITRAYVPVWLGGLPVHIDLPSVAGLLGFRSRAEQARHVEPDVETDRGRRV